MKYVIGKDLQQKAIAAHSRPTADLPGPPALWWRLELPLWPNSWRREWGERANAYEVAGADWRSAEEQAFREVAAAHGEDS